MASNTSSMIFIRKYLVIDRRMKGKISELTEKWKEEVII